MKNKIIFIFFIFTLILSSIVYAHPGRTDSNGGHYNRSTGEYHYHHGYPEHQHPGGICPYNNNVKSNSSTSSNSKEISNKINNIISAKNETTNVTHEAQNEVTFMKKYGFLIGLLVFFSFIYFIDSIQTFVKINSKTDTQSDTNKTIQKPKYICPKCGDNLIIKKGKYGAFIGCSNYPYCKYTRKLNSKSK